jgi:hypothetical protein
LIPTNRTITSPKTCGLHKDKWNKHFNTVKKIASSLRNAAMCKKRVQQTPAVISHQIKKNPFEAILAPVLLL